MLFNTICAPASYRTLEIKPQYSGHPMLNSDITISRWGNKKGLYGKSAEMFVQEVIVMPHSSDWCKAHGPVKFTHPVDTMTVLGRQRGGAFVEHGSTCNIVGKVKSTTLTIAAGAPDLASARTLAGRQVIRLGTTSFNARWGRRDAVVLNHRPDVLLRTPTTHAHPPRYDRTQWGDWPFLETAEKAIMSCFKLGHRAEPLPKLVTIVNWPGTDWFPEGLFDKTLVGLSRKTRLACYRVITLHEYIRDHDWRGVLTISEVEKWKDIGRLGYEWRMDKKND